jgi:hypothetical protein
MSRSVVTAAVPITERRRLVAVAPAQGRFSNGIEQLPETPSHVRVGSFADGYEQVGRR